MIQLFDTHRLSYRNAKLRAWALADKTRRVNFQDYSSEDNEWTSIGTDVITDESGYLFYADGTQKIECLGVEEAAIVDVSLDGGQSYLIQFIIYADHDPSALHAGNIYGLTYTNSSGNSETYNPADGPKTLPNYLLRSEYTQGDWREQTIITRLSDINGSAITISDFTHLILIWAHRDSSDVLTFNLPNNKALRAGQVIHIYAGFDSKLKFNTVSTPSQEYPVVEGHIYALHNNGGLNKLLLTDITGGIGYRKMTYHLTATNPGNIQISAPASADNLIYVDIDAYDARNDIATFTVYVPMPDNHICDVVVRLRNYSGDFDIRLAVGTIGSISGMTATAEFENVAGDVQAGFHVVKVQDLGGMSTLLNQDP